MDCGHVKIYFEAERNYHQEHVSNGLSYLEWLFDVLQHLSGTSIPFEVELASESKILN